MEDVNGKEVLINGKTFDEIANRYFDSPWFRESYTKDEQALLKEGFKEGLSYLYPLYHNADTLVTIFEKVYQLKEQTKVEPIIIQTNG